MDILSMDNNAILSELKASLDKECSKYTWDFNASENELKMRKPNDKEIREWLETQWRYIYLSGYYHDKIPTAVYRTLKGMIRHGNFDPVFGYIRKLGLNYDIQKLMKDYAESECMADVKVNVTFPGIVTRSIVDIDLSKEIKKPPNKPIMHVKVDHYAGDYLTHKRLKQTFQKSYGDKYDVIFTPSLVDIKADNMVSITVTGSTNYNELIQSIERITETRNGG